MATTGIVLYVAYPSLIMNLIQATQCLDDINVLRFNPDISCDSDDYKLTYVAVILPGIVLWLGILPILALIMMIKNFNQIHLPKNTDSIV